MSKIYDLSAIFAYLAAPAQKPLLAAASADPIRYNLNGVYVDVDASRLVATDGHRLHVQPLASTPADLASLPGSLVLPREVWEVRKDLISRDSGHYCTVTVERVGYGSDYDHRWTLTCGQRTYSVRLSGSQFPQWQQVIPKNTSEFELIEPKTKLPEGKNDVVELSCADNKAGFRLKTEGSENPTFNAVYIKDALRHVGGSVRAHYDVRARGLSPVRLVGASGREAIVMPRRRC